MSARHANAQNLQRGALLLATLLALAALSLLGAAALEAVLLEQRMAGNVALRQTVLAAADHALDEVERQLQNAVAEADAAWLEAAMPGQSQPLPQRNVAATYAVTFCCATAWDASLPVDPDNSAGLYHIDVQATAIGNQARVALQSTYLIAPATASLPMRARRAAWRLR